MPDPQTQPAHAPPSPNVLGALVLALFCLFTLVRPSGRGSVDEEFIYRTTYSLVHHGSLRFAPLDRPGEAEVPAGQRVAGKFGILPSVAAVPFHLVGMALAGFVPSDLSEDVLRAATYTSSCLWMALAAMQLAATLAALGYPRKVQTAVALLFALATPAIVYARFFHVAALATLLIAALMHAAVRFDRRPVPRTAAWLGAWLGLLLLVGFNFAILVPVVVLFVAAARTQRRRENTAAVAAPILAASAVVIVVNLLRGHHLFRGGYVGESFITPLSIGLYGVLLSAGRGLLIYSPLCVAGVLLLPSFWRAHRRLAWLSVSIVLLVTLSYAKWFAWNGGIYWGPRYLVPLLPITLLPLAPYLARWYQKPVAGRITLVLVALIALAVQWRGVATHYFAAMGQVSMLAASQNEQLFVPHLQPLWWQGHAPTSFLWAEWDARGYTRLARAGALLFAVSAIASLAYVATGAGLLRALPRALPAAGWGWLLFLAAGCALWLGWRSAGHGLLRPAGGGAENAQTIDFRQPRWRWRSDRATTWSGFLRVPQNGDYQFFLNSHGASQLTLRQQSGPDVPELPRVDHPAGDPRWSIWAGRLNVGIYRVALTSHPGTGGFAEVSLLWTVHGGGIDRQPIDPQFLYPESPGPVRSLVDRAMGMAWLALLLVALIALGVRSAEHAKQ